MKKGLWIVAGVLAAGVAQGNIGGFCAAVDVAGNHAYIGAGQILLAVDVTDPSNMICSGSLIMPGLIEDVLTDGTVLYAACGEAGVKKIEITDPSNMRTVAVYDSPGHAYGLTLGGASLYLADGVSGLQVLDPDTLALMGRYSTNAPAMDVIAEGAAIYLLDHFNGIIALDTGLNETGGYDMIAFGNRMVSDGTLLYATDGEGKVTEIAMASMTLVTNQLVGIPVYGIAIEGSDVFVARGDSGVQLLGGELLSTSGSASGLAIDGGRLYVADGFGGLSVFDSASKALLGSFEHVSRSRANAIHLNYAYLAAGNSGVKVFDLTDPSRPAHVALVAMSNALDVAVSGDRLLVADTFRGVEIYDLAAPTNPVLIGNYTMPSNTVARRVTVAGTDAYVAAGYTVNRMDISIPSSPTIIGSSTLSDYVFDLDVAGTNVLLATGNGMQVLSGDLTPLSSAALPDSVHTITASGNYALAGWNYMDLSSPLTPVAVTNFGSLVHAMQLTLRDGAIFASADDGGTALLPLPLIDSDGDGLDDALEQLIIDFDQNDDISALTDVHPDDDFDADGLSNIYEQIAGTSPVDAGSVFAISGLDAEASGFAVSWYSCAGHTYAVHKSTNLVEGFYILESGIQATEPINSYIDAESDECAMYMITVDL